MNVSSFLIVAIEQTAFTDVSELVIGGNLRFDLKLEQTFCTRCPAGTLLVGSAGAGAAAAAAGAGSAAAGAGAAFGAGAAAGSS